MTLESVLYLFITTCLAIIAFFLVRFYFLVDEIRKDVKDLLIKDAGTGKDIEILQDHVSLLGKKYNSHDKRIQELEFSLKKTR